MSFRFRPVVLLSVCVTCVGLVVGCGPQDQTGGDSSGAEPAEEVDPHDVPLTEEQKQQLKEETAKFADAIGCVKKFRDTVQAETKDGLPENPFDAHQALDRADLVVQWLPGIARDSNIAKEHWETVNVAANELREMFDKVHQNIDNKADPDFGSVEQQMDAKIAELEAISQ